MVLLQHLAQGDSVEPNGQEDKDWNFDPVGTRSDHLIRKKKEICSRCVGP